MFAARAEHVDQLIVPGAAGRPLGAVRPLHRRHLRLPVRRPRTVRSAGRGARGVGSPGPAARPDAAVRHRSGDRRRAPGARAGGRPLRERTGRLLRARARRLPGARTASTPRASWPSMPTAAHRVARARAPGARRGDRTMVTLKDLPWHTAAWAAIAPLWGRGAHAILLHGMAGIGKKHLALDVAAGLLCERPGPLGQPCRQCASCHWFEAGNHPDARVVVPDALAELRPASAESAKSMRRRPPTEAEGAGDRTRRRREIVLDQVRGLNDFVAISTHRGGRRVAVIAPAEDLRIEAANRLLKLLEEPPPASVFVLATDALDAVLPTIRSRCVLVRVAAPSPDVAARWLEGPGRGRCGASTGVSRRRAARGARRPCRRAAGGTAGALSAAGTRPAPDAGRDRWGDRQGRRVGRCARCVASRGHSTCNWSPGN